jgi:hypothetical protein
MQKQGLLLGLGGSTEMEDLGQAGTDSDESLKKPTKRRSRVNSLKPPAEKLKEKISNSSLEA